MIYSFSSMTEQPGAGQPDFRSGVEQSNPLFRASDVNSSDITLAKKIALEMVQVNGADTLIHMRTNNSDHDKVFDEDPNPTYWNPVSIKGFFVPQPLEYELTLWGVDSANKVEIVFALEQVSDVSPIRLFRVGDLVEVPYRSQSQQKPKYYAIDNAQETGNFRYTWLYLKCQATLIVGDIYLRPAQDMVQTIEEYTDEVS